MVALAQKTFKQVKRLVIGLIGFTVLAIGVAMIVLPGPAFIVIPIGLGILATEFIWAKSLLRRVKQRITKNNKGKGVPPKD
jgi:tellurite resistance protein TerC